MKKLLEKLNLVNNFEQVKNSFDKKTVWKIVKGALISFSGIIALGILSQLGQVSFSNPQLTMFVAWVTPFIVNIIKEYMSGK